MVFKDSLMRRETPVVKTGPSSVRTLEYRLPGGRTVRLDECSISLSRLGFLAGHEERIREKVVNELPKLVHAQFPGNYGVVIKPVPEGRLPTYTFMAALTCDQPVSDPTADFSSLVICWLSDDIEMPLMELIECQLRSIDWNTHAVDGNF